MHPAFFFIKYLIVALPDSSEEIVNSNLLLNGMATATVELIEKARAEASATPAEFRPWDSRHRGTTSWLKTQKIDTIVRQDEYVRNIDGMIIAKPRDREVLERLLLSGMSPKEVCYRLSGLDIHIPDMTIAAYKHYFWNTDIMSLSQWSEYFKNDDSDRINVTKGLYSSALHAGPEAALLRLGLKKQVDSKKIMVDIQKELYATFLETKALPLSDKKVSMLTDLARGLAKIDERVQAGDSALLDTLKKFEKFKILTPEDNMRKIADLSAKGTTTYRKDKRKA